MTKKNNRGANRRKTISGLNFNLEDISPLTDNQAKVLRSERNQVLHGCAGTGKAQPGYSKIRTPGGWTTMEKISIGDSVITPTNNKATVINKFYHASKPVYRIHLQDGRFVDACDEHLWKLQTERKTLIAQTKDIPELLEKNRNRVYIPLCNPITEPSIPYKIHPYIIGALIGDGCISGTLRATVSSADSFIIDKIASLLPAENTIRKIPSSKYDYSIVCKPPHTNNFLVQELTKLDMMGKTSYYKTIPLIYMHGNLEDRISLLQGLFDTDGTVDNRNSIEFSTTSLELANQVAELIYSLGGVCSIAERMGSCNGKDTATNYRVRPSKLSYDLKKRLFSLPRKAERIKPGQYDKSRNNKIIKIEFIGNMDCWCISLDSTDKLYLTDNYIVTHNTFLSSYLAYKALLEKEYGKLIYIRSAVATRDIGFLPGTEKEKVAVYELPYKDIANELFDRGGTYDELKAKGVVEFMTTSHVRGVTLNDSIVIVDEIQNMSFHELDSVITRYGRDCKYFFCGDFRQADLKGNGIKKFLEILHSMDSDFDYTEFTEEDIVRSDIVKRYIIARNKYESGTKQ